MSACTSTTPDPDPISAGLSAQGTVVPYVSVAPYSKLQASSSTPCGLMKPLRVALSPVTFDASPVASRTAAGVVNVSAAPGLVPFSLLARRRKWYVVLASRPVRAAETELSEVPVKGPAGLQGAVG